MLKTPAGLSQAQQQAYTTAAYTAVAARAYGAAQAAAAAQPAAAQYAAAVARWAAIPTLLLLFFYRVSCIDDEQAGWIIYKETIK